MSGEGSANAAPYEFTHGHARVPQLRRAARAIQVQRELKAHPSSARDFGLQSSCRDCRSADILSQYDMPRHSYEIAIMLQFVEAPRLQQRQAGLMPVIEM